MITNTSVCICETVLSNYRIKTTEHAHSSALSSLCNDTGVFAELLQIMKVHSLSTYPQRHKDAARKGTEQGFCLPGLLALQRKLKQLLLCSAITFLQRHPPVKAMLEQIFLPLTEDLSWFCQSNICLWTAGPLKQSWGLLPAAYSENVPQNPKKSHLTHWKLRNAWHECTPHTNQYWACA